MLKTPEFESVEAEFERARGLVKGGGAAFDTWKFVYGNEGKTTGFCGDTAVTEFLCGLGSKLEQILDSKTAPIISGPVIDCSERQKRQVDELVRFTDAHQLSP